MTQEEILKVREFETRVRQLILKLEEQKVALSRLQDEKANLEKQLQVAQLQIEKNKEQYHLLKASQLISVSEEDYLATKKHLKMLIKKIEKSINLIDFSR